MSRESVARVSMLFKSSMFAAKSAQLSQVFSPKSSVRARLRKLKQPWGLKKSPSMESMVDENHQLFEVVGKTDPFLLLAAVMCNRLEQPTY